MTDEALDLRLARELRRYSDRGVRPIDAMAIAGVALGRGARRRSRLDMIRPARWSSRTDGHAPGGAPLGDAASLLDTDAERGPWRPTLKVAHKSNAAGLAIVAAAVLVAIAGLSLMPSLVRVMGPPTTASPSPSPTVQPSRSPTASGVDRDRAVFPVARRSMTVDGIPISFSVPSEGWVPFGSLLVSKSITGPQGAEAIVFWAGFPDGRYADPCINAPIDEWDAADVAAGVARAPGTELLAPPTDVTVGGRPAKYVEVVVREDAGCDPGFFYNWKAQTGGALWVTSELGDSIRVWVVDVDGTLLFIAGEIHRNTVPGVALSEDGRARLEREIQQIVDSIEFE